MGDGVGGAVADALAGVGVEDDGEVVFGVLVGVVADDGDVVDRHGGAPF